VCHRRQYREGSITTCRMGPTIQMHYFAVDELSGLQIKQQVGYFSNFGQPLEWTQLLEIFMRFDGIHRGCLRHQAAMALKRIPSAANSIAGLV